MDETMARRITDQQALDRIQHLLQAPEWDSAADYCEWIAEIVGETGRSLETPEGYSRDGDEEDDDETCSNCGERVEYVSSRFWCDGCEEEADQIDTSSSASRQHYIDTGRYLTIAEVPGCCENGIDICPQHGENG